MKRSCSFLLFLISTTALFGMPIKTYFIGMPESITPLITKTDKEDFVDYLDSKMRAKVTNSMGGETEMTQLTADFIELKYTQSSTIQLKKLPLTDSTFVVCVIETACGPVCDSKISFYAADYSPLPFTTYIQLPTLPSFYQSNTTTSENQELLNRLIDIVFIEAVLSAETNTLTFRLSTPDYLERTNAQLLKPLIQSLRYVWKEGKFTNSPIH